MTLNQGQFNPDSTLCAKWDITVTNNTEIIYMCEFSKVLLWLCVPGAYKLSNGFRIYCKFPKYCHCRFELSGITAVDCQNRFNAKSSGRRGYVRYNLKDIFLISQQIVYCTPHGESEGGRRK